MAGRVLWLPRKHLTIETVMFWNYGNDQMMKKFFSSKFNYINKHLYLENNFNHLKQRYTDLCNILTERAWGEPTKHACGF